MNSNRAYIPKKKLEIPENFNFPYEPYDIQKELMQEVYSTLEQQGIGIFESPTGTGKSLTLTCAALRWLEDHEALVREDLEKRIENVKQEVRRLNEKCDIAIDWITAQFELSQQREELRDLQSLHILLKKHEEKLVEIYKQNTQMLRKRQSKNLVEQQRILQMNLNAIENQNDNDGPIENAQWSQLFNDISVDETTDMNDDITSEKYRNIQIFFCSRTHAQLSQVMLELKKTVYGKRIRCVSLASRQHLCIHPQLSKLNNGAVINERCIDMLRSTTKKHEMNNDHKIAHTNKRKSTTTNNCCAFKNVQNVEKLSNATLMQIMDIEDLVNEGKQTKSCPYYSARAATKMAQLIMIPYQIILHRNTRLQSGIDLRDSIVIIDEAHNLLDTIAKLYSCEITLQQLQLLSKQMNNYKMCYSERFNTSNLLNINQLIFIIKRLIKLLKPSDVNEKILTSTRTLRTYELMAEGDFFNIDIAKLLKFCDNMRFAQKLQGYVNTHNLNDKNEQMLQIKNETPIAKAKEFLQLLEQEQSNKKSKIKIEKNINDKQQNDNDILTNNENRNETNVNVAYTAIRPFLTFLTALTENADDGRILIVVNETETVGKNASLLKYVLLNPGSHFQDIIREARAIIIAGGTMQPTNEITEQLFYNCTERLKLCIYNHVVPIDAVLPFIVSSGPTGQNICFNYAQRNSKKMLMELGMILQNICNVVPDGIICFLPSYDFLDIIYKYLNDNNILMHISKKKRIFCETHTQNLNAGQTVDKLLADYAMAIKCDDKKGALLLSVVGGKLSEGLNFTDELGRAVIVVGMPYPNRQSPELQERINYLDKMLCNGAGNEYYENLCMKAVNQCIGRSVRHIKDYAAVFLIDQRYNNERIRKKLPQWIERNLQIPKTFGQIQLTTVKYFKTKQQ